ncbi:tol-pal system protein YbgF [Halomonas sp. KAO]|uniref:tol-pal system protein YbgF n=1 Tax=unclassified Halomonas TaxID=2609666 RepID=UPI0018A0F0FC|nr:MULTISPECIES: tol-pal system protein YbgF [unclassified Halomonas]MBF7052468.1 tol-pal system protein YbgF [Halomonas sp. KAO]MDT0499800.1 tol-pal system protein YbgF [Halomonas sp. PAR7]MDT0510383.1 tol-pal system protein YbgF [Halomonas sp. LES1]MDT0589908.1 tol-pal system protein YbgF [Halomonas sp. PAR8]
MEHGLKRLCGAGALVLPLSVGVPALAQQPVVEDLTAQSSTFYQQTDTREAAGGSLVIFNQVQEHQEELRRLRGQVEELRHQLEQLRGQTRQQYMDLEDRLASVSAGMSRPALEEEARDERPDDEAGGNRKDEEAGTASPNAEDPDAQAAYQKAFSSVQAREFDRAIAAFERFVGSYPESRLTPNAHYWLGELHAAEGRLEPAEAAFRTVLDDYPESNKVPDALYKLGLLKARMGQPDASRELLERVREAHPESTAAGLAGDFLRQSGN